MRKVGIGCFPFHQSIKGRQTSFFIAHLWPAYGGIQRNFRGEVSGTKLDVLHSPIVDAAEPLPRVFLIFGGIFGRTRSFEFVVATLAVQLCFDVGKNALQLTFALLIAISRAVSRQLTRTQFGQFMLVNSSTIFELLASLHRAIRRCAPSNHTRPRSSTSRARQTIANDSVFNKVGQRVLPDQHTGLYAIATSNIQ